MWSEDITESSLVRLPEGAERLTAACWSPTRPSLFFTARYRAALVWGKLPVKFSNSL